MIVSYCLEHGFQFMMQLKNWGIIIYMETGRTVYCLLCLCHYLVNQYWIDFLFSISVYQQHCQTSIVFAFFGYAEGETVSLYGLLADTHQLTKELALRANARWQRNNARGRWLVIVIWVEISTRPADWRWQVYSPLWGEMGLAGWLLAAWRTATKGCSACVFTDIFNLPFPLSYN